MSNVVFLFLVNQHHSHFCIFATFCNSFLADDVVSDLLWHLSQSESVIIVFLICTPVESVLPNFFADIRRFGFLWLMKEACLLLPSLSDVFPLGQRARHNWRKTHYFLYLHMYLQNIFAFLFDHDILSFNINLIGYTSCHQQKFSIYTYIHLFILCCAHFLSAGIPLIRGRGEPYAYYSLLLLHHHQEPLFRLHWYILSPPLHHQTPQTCVLCSTLHLKPDARHLCHTTKVVAKNTKNAPLNWIDFESRNNHISLIWLPITFQTALCPFIEPLKQWEKNRVFVSRLTKLNQGHFSKNKTDFDQIKNLAAGRSGFLIDEMENWCHVCINASFLEQKQKVSIVFQNNKNFLQMQTDINLTNRQSIVMQYE